MASGLKDTNSRVKYFNIKDLRILTFLESKSLS